MYNGLLEKFEAVYPENFNFAYDVVDVIGTEEPNKRAMLWCNDKGDERDFSFGDMKKYSDIAANILTDAGVKRGDRVLIILKRHYQFWFICLALHKIGAIGIPATNLLMAHDIEYRCNAAGIMGVICTTDGDLPSRVEEAMPKCPTVTMKMTVKGEREGWLNFDNLLKTAKTTFERRDTLAEDPILLYFTSGTTGMPKMVVHSHTYPMAHIPTAKYWHNVNPNGLHLTLSDSGWMKFMWGKLYGQWFMEAPIFCCDFDRFAPAQLLTLFAKYKITTFCAPPTMFRLFIQEDLSSYDLSSLEYACIAGEALNPEVFEQFKKHTGLKLMEGFGQTETTLTVFNQKGTDPKPGSMGKASPAYDVVVVDSEGNLATKGATGEICVRITDGKKPVGMFSGYYQNDLLTEQVCENGLYHTGDIAWVDEDGYFWYVGRNDDIIKSSGYRIGPFEIESVLMEHPAVVECAVTGVPDPIRGQVVMATIVLANGYSASEELKKELQDYVKKQTAPYKYPRIVEFVTDLPKTISGKIKRKEIRDSKEM
jgi:acetyl-CoA synthetase